jgi:hypothetical protein
MVDFRICNKRTNLLSSQGVFHRVVKKDASEEGPHMHSKLKNLHEVPLEVVHTSQMVDVP